MQIILWNDAAAGRLMRWSVPMKEREGGEGVDIIAEMKSVMQKATDEDQSDS